jgi:hypothetical protein
MKRPICCGVPYIRTRSARATVLSIDTMLTNGSGCSAFSNDAFQITTVMITN